MTLFESLIVEFAEKTGQNIAPSSDGSVVVEADGSMRDCFGATAMLNSFTPSLLTGGVRAAVENGQAPMDLVKIANNAFLDCFKDATFPVELSEEHEKMIGGLIDEMRSRYGNAVSKDTTYSSLCDMKTMYERLKDVVENATNDGRLVKANEIKDAISADFRRGAARLAIKQYATDYASKNNLPKPDVSFGINIDSHDPGMVDDIVAANTPAETLEAIKCHEDKIKAYLEMKERN